MLVEAMLEHNALELLVQRLVGLKEEAGDEASAVFNIFNIFENMIEVKPEVAEMLVQKTKVQHTYLFLCLSRTYCSNIEM